jgi:hypothetical protein
VVPGLAIFILVKSASFYDFLFPENDPKPLRLTKLDLFRDCSTISAVSFSMGKHKLNS